jgi:hypothetical protein
MVLAETRQKILEEFQLFLLLKALIEMDQKPVNQSPMDEVAHLYLLQVFSELRLIDL